MKTAQIHSNRQRIEHLFDKYGQLPDDSQIQAHWARYLCVICSGYIETSIQSIYADFARRKSSPQVARYVESQIGRAQNLNMEKICQITSAFSQDWLENLHGNRDFDQLKDSVDSIINNRNQIAHGANVGVSYYQIREYFTGATKLIDLLLEQCSDRP